MTVLIVGLILFLGVHSIRIYAENWRTRQLARLGEARWKGIYSLVSALGLGLIVWGVGLTRADPVLVWAPSAGLRHLAGALSLPAFILLAAAYVPANRIRKVVGHPMVAGVAVWALAHLVSNGRLSDLLLFGGFLGWSVLSYSAAWTRDRDAGVTRAAGNIRGDALTVVIGGMGWAAFAGYLHAWMIGLHPY